MNEPGASYVASSFHRLRDLGPATFVNHLLHDMDDDEVEHVEHFKYKQVLERKLTVTSIVGLGFTLMGVPFGLSSTLWISLVDGGLVTILYGWLLVGFFSFCVVLSLSEIIAKYPTAGGVYHFSAILSNERYSLISSWFTGWFLLIGNWTYAVSVLFLGSQFILSIFGLKNVYYKQDMLFVLGVYFIMLSVVGVINFKCSRYLEHINKLCIFWSISTVIVVDILLLIFAKHTNSALHIFTHFDNSRSGWPDPLAFMVGMQSSSFTLTGYGMLFSMTDEVKKPEKNMPRGAISSMFMLIVQGLFFIIPVLLILPSLLVLLDSNPEIMPIDLVFKTATESYIVSFLLIILLIGTVLFQAIGALTTASRSTYAFARDGGLPWKDIWTQVDSVEEYTLPKNALFLSMGVIAVFSFIALISPSAFNAFMGASVVSLALANGIPILCLMFNKRRKIKGSAFRLRYCGWIINGISVFWVFLSFFILCMPPVIKDLTWRSMNYASVVLVLLILVALLGYKTWGANVFTGPPLDTDYVELHNMEAQSHAVKIADQFVIGDDEDVDKQGEAHGPLDDGAKSPKAEKGWTSSEARQADIEAVVQDTPAEEGSEQSGDERAHKGSEVHELSQVPKLLSPKMPNPFDDPSQLTENFSDDNWDDFDEEEEYTAASSRASRGQDNTRGEVLFDVNLEK